MGNTTTIYETKQVYIYRNNQQYVVNCDVCRNILTHRHLSVICNHIGRCELPKATQRNFKLVYHCPICMRELHLTDPDDIEYHNSYCRQLQRQYNRTPKIPPVYQPNYLDNGENNDIGDIEDNDADDNTADVKTNKTSECNICMENPKNTVLIPCGHVLCSGCSTNISTCPFCRQNIAQIYKIYL